MRKLQLSCLGMLLLASQGTSANTSIGIDMISDSATRTVSSSFGEGEGSADADGIRLRLSYDSGKNRAVELYLSSYSVDTAADLDTIDDNELDFGANLVFLGSPGTFIPFGKFGAGFGSVPLDPTAFSEDSISNVHINAGAGAKLMVTENLAVVGSLEATYRIWQSIEVLSTTIDIEDKVLRLGLGLEFSF